MGHDEALRDIAVSEGASLFGVADLSEIETPASFPYAVSAAVRLSKAILDDIDEHPTKIYFHHYRMVNGLLDRIALKLTLHIQEQGYQALPVPASQIIDWENQKGHLSHKAVAELAGLGWIGRNNLLVTPEFGSQVRLVTVLTDMSLTPGKPVEKNCGECSACVDVCPAGAIKMERADFDHISCYNQLKDFRSKGYVGQFVCGICVKACGMYNSPKVEKL